ncbi:hypothetical protein AS850_02980 [Frondihabitans sp. 762G35]|uniref:ImmA/IrrE family metallo-endopeptidase n=1 Tax=Frondihabitans sp. 762G35 TaxID=1446794 RepID=UPI000D2031BE|nr:ImmA/IrrE family metallo-endopeptidase [Frondihabitans sp. 762G35]ARC56037.1 hypothetical protein AS850_02980 [Frondihabitans sp. 762G35]
MKDLIHIAASLGLRIHASHLPAGILGMFSSAEGRIYFDLHLTPHERRSVIAHELGHAYYGHDCDHGESSAQERQADAYAAALLVDPYDYAELERISADAHYIAEELGVTEDVVYAFRAHCLKQYGRRTYSGRVRIS